MMCHGVTNPLFCLQGSGRMGHQGPSGAGACWPGASAAPVGPTHVALYCLFLPFPAVKPSLDTLECRKAPFVPKLQERRRIGADVRRSECMDLVDAKYVVMQDT